MSKRELSKIWALFFWLPEDPAVNQDENGKTESHDKAYFGCDEGGRAHVEDCFRD
jgi:hypothetical protein